MMSPSSLSWSGELVRLYESGAASQFVLHGNVGDVYLLPSGRGVAALDLYLRELLLGGFQVVLSYDVGSGLRVEKGGEVFAQWPAFKDRALPSHPREAVQVITHYLRFCAHLSRLKTERTVQVAVIVRAADLMVPATGNGVNYELSGMALQVREWGSDPLLAGSHCATFLLTENLSDLHPLIVQSGYAAKQEVPLPGAEDLERALGYWQGLYPLPLADYAGRLAEPAAALVGASFHAIERLMRLRQHEGGKLGPGDLVRLKKELIEQDAAGLIEFVKPDRTLEDMQGQEGLKLWLRQDMDLWRRGELAAMPMGYLICGPVGTGKTFLVECLAGEAEVPVVKLKNFRDKWVGSTESNLEKIFRLLAALGRCVVFVDEADQALGRRSGDSGDSGVGGRVYGMMAEQMSNSRNRGKILWVLATSRPDLVEVDLKRPGRVDVKIPLFPTATPEEGYHLIRALARRRGVDLPEVLAEDLMALIPDLVTPGAAEALSVKLYRAVVTSGEDGVTALRDALDDYQAPVRPEIIESQIRLAVAEATDLSFVPQRFR